jgi:hypothetical protein
MTLRQLETSHQTKQQSVNTKRRATSLGLCCVQAVIPKPAHLSRWLHATQSEMFKTGDVRTLAEAVRRHVGEDWVSTPRGHTHPYLTLTWLVHTTSDGANAPLFIHQVIVAMPAPTSSLHHLCTQQVMVAMLAPTSPHHHLCIHHIPLFCNNISVELGRLRVKCV